MIFTMSFLGCEGLIRRAFQISAAQITIKQILSITIWPGKHLPFCCQTVQPLPWREKATFAGPGTSGTSCVQAKTHYLSTRQV